MPASERIPPRDLSTVSPSRSLPGARALEEPGTARLLAEGELRVLGSLHGASNAVFRCEVEGAGRRIDCVYKPIAGERPLWDFPHGTLAQREVAAYEVCRAMGWELVPPTVLRDGPYGEGMCQLWIDADPEAELLALVDAEQAGPGWKAVGRAEVAEGRTALLVHADTPGLRRMAVLDAVINNGDRKGGHLLPTADGRLHGIDHGVAFHPEDKLRTLLWGWAGEPLPRGVTEVLGRLSLGLSGTGALADRLRELITAEETAALRERVDRLVSSGRHPVPSGQWPAIPWPPV
ncbi:SCO1664 family protein [Streptomyces sp. TP-A0874]|uniref:SCO1664 family protein n=1 Tax=Streptomyces sp. TP-A0874 TaxID=549819 RepID=UPI0009A00640|nr:SCO1664 family protein [Streptomyces sp. TP-A0874]